MTRLSWAQAPWAAGAALALASATLLCLIPRPEGDLFFALRTGDDLLRAGRVPHADAYSWSRAGARWDVPEWGAFALYALAYRAGGLGGTWAVLAALTSGAALAAWGRLARAAGPAWGAALASVALLAMAPGLQERPYAFSYLLLAVSLTLLTRGREAGRGRALLWLPPLCAAWANLHQGVVVLPCLALAYGAGDALAGAWASARRMLVVAGACAGAALASPYGGRLYWNVFVTLRDHALMAHVTEWEPAWTVPPGQLGAFGLLAALLGAALALSRRPRLADGLAAAALLGEALRHVRDVPLFALGGVIVLAPHVGDALRRVWGEGAVKAPAGARGVGLGLAGVAYVGLLGLVAGVTVRRAGGPGVGLGAAVAEAPRFPGAACAFADARGFPDHLRLLNDLGDGGFLIWRLPREPVFIDGRLDVYAGRVFDDNLRLVRADGSPAWAALARRYDFDGVLTASRREAAAFAALPDWRLVYADPVDPAHPGRPRHRLLLRRRPRFAALIARCLAAPPPP